MWSNDGIAWILWGQAWDKQEAGDGAGLGDPGVGESLDGTVEYKAKPDVFLFIILVSFPLPSPGPIKPRFHLHQRMRRSWRRFQGPQKA